MNDENKNTITYDDNWKNVSEREYPQIVGYEASEGERENKQSVKKKKSGNSQLLITVQLIVCILIALTAFLLKSFGGEFYSNASDWYYSQLNNSVIFDDKSTFDLTNITNSSTQDEI